MKQPLLPCRGAVEEALQALRLQGLPPVLSVLLQEGATFHMRATSAMLLATKRSSAQGQFEGPIVDISNVDEDPTEDIKTAATTNPTDIFKIY